MSTISYIVVLFAFCWSVNNNNAVKVFDITFKRSKDLSVIQPLSASSYSFMNTDSSTMSCIQHCTLHEICEIVWTTDDRCYAGRYPTSATYMYTDNWTADVYVKTHVQACSHSEYNFYKGLCIRRVTDRLNWYDARNFCRRENAQLVVMDSIAKFDLLLEFLDKTYNRNLDQFYVGANDFEKEGVWRWDQERASTLFPESEFNNRDNDFPGSDADCACLKLKNLDIVDEYCGHEKMFLCEIRI